MDFIDIIEKSGMVEKFRSNFLRFRQDQAVIVQVKEDLSNIYYMHHSQNLLDGKRMQLAREYYNINVERDSLIATILCELRRLLTYLEKKGIGTNTRLAVENVTRRINSIYVRSSPIEIRRTPEYRKLLGKYMMMELMPSTSGLQKKNPSKRRISSVNEPRVNLPRPQKNVPFFIRD